MSLKAGIVGLPNVGKSTLFNAITNSKVEAANYPFATIEPNVGVVEVKDERLIKLSAMYEPKKTVFTTFAFTDIAGLVKGASQGEGLGNKFLANIREVDAICHVVRCFVDTDISHVYETVDPIRDIEVIDYELIMADLTTINNRLSKVEKKAQIKDKEALYEKTILDKVKSTLEKGHLIDTRSLDKEELSYLKSLNLLTIKPVIYIANVKEEAINNPDSDPYYVKVRDLAKSQGNEVVAISAKIEEDLSGLDKQEKAAFLEDLGIHRSGLDELITKAYHLLGLKTFFTVGKDECRGWTYKDGMTAPECAGIIHTDFQKGFIRAEVFTYEDIIHYESESKLKEAGKLRLEGKDYIVNDGDIMYFRFNV